MWHDRQVELGSLPISRYDPPALGECMLWQPVHSATPPEWKACGLLPQSNSRTATPSKV